MKFWLVSRETLEEAKSSRDRIIERLEKEILELKEDRKVTVDVLSVRALGVSIYGKIQVPKEEESEPEQPERSAEEQQPVPLGRARAIARFQSATNLEQYAKEQAEMMRLVESAVEEGRRAAEVPTNGNGNHS